MSLKPPKHSEMKWPDKRESKKRKISLDYNLIVTEGTKTEPQYFEALKENINRNERNRIQLEIIGSGKNTRVMSGSFMIWMIFRLTDLM